MNIFVLIGQRKADATGEYPLEAFDCMDEVNYRACPMHLEGMMAKYAKCDQFGRLGIVQMSVDPQSIIMALDNSQGCVSASVTNAE